MENHPCFNPSAATLHSRIHLPVAPACNIQCRFCNRRYDCAGELRPGVTSAVLSPKQALHYLKEALVELGPVAVVALPGPVMLLRNHVSLWKLWTLFELIIRKLLCALQQTA